MTMATSVQGRSLIKEHEGLRLEAYLCPAGKWTIGWGHTSAAGAPDVVPGMVITRAEAEAILRADLARFEARVNRLVKIPLTQNQFDALVSFDFNTGKLHASTLLKRLNAGRHDEVPAQLMRWTKARDPKTGQMVDHRGLVRRRRDEAALWRSLDERATGGRADVGEVAQPAPPKSIAQSKTGAAAVATGIAGAAAPVAEAVQAARETADGVSGLMAAGPWVLLALVIVAAAAFIWWDRRRRLQEDGL